MTVGFRTLDVGEQALVFDIKGRARVEEGPKRLFLFREKYRELRRHCADQTEYIEINHRDGHIEHKPGPCVVFENPVFHARVRIDKGISLDANEVLVSYRADQKTLEVQRHIHYGPTLFIQQASEWLHEFVWHGRDPDSKVKKLPGRLRFNKLRVIPGQFYYNVEDVRTSDDAVITVKLMIFYELKDIEQMLNSTQDPIADFINCLSADVVAYASKLTYIEFIENSGDLNDLTRYPQTLERSAAIGYDVSKVVYRGYHADEKLQCMHNRAVAERAKLKINFEKEQQEQTLTDFQLRKEMERISTEQQMEIEATKHKHQMEKAKLQHKLALQEKEQRERIARWKADKQSEIKRHEAEDSHKLDHYRKLSGLSVNMTDYLVSLNPRPDKLVRVVAPDDTTKIHLHQN